MGSGRPRAGPRVAGRRSRTPRRRSGAAQAQLQLPLQAALDAPQQLQLVVAQHFGSAPGCWIWSCACEGVERSMPPEAITSAAIELMSLLRIRPPYYG